MTSHCNWIKSWTAIRSGTCLLLSPLSPLFTILQLLIFCTLDTSSLFHSQSLWICCSRLLIILFPRSAHGCPLLIIHAELKCHCFQRCFSILWERQSLLHYALLGYLISTSSEHLAVSEIIWFPPSPPTHVFTICFCLPEYEFFGSVTLSMSSWLCPQWLGRCLA